MPSLLRDPDETLEIALVPMPRSAGRSQVYEMRRGAESIHGMDAVGRTVRHLPKPAGRTAALPTWRHRLMSNGSGGTEVRRL
jgi:hypothetical protein